MLGSSPKSAPEETSIFGQKTRINGQAPRTRPVRPARPGTGPHLLGWIGNSLPLSHYQPARDLRDNVTERPRFAKWSARLVSMPLTFGSAIIVLAAAAFGAWFLTTNSLSECRPPTDGSSAAPPAYCAGATPTLAVAIWIDLVALALGVGSLGAGFAHTRRGRRLSKRYAPSIESAKAYYADGRLDKRDLEEFLAVAQPVAMGRPSGETTRAAGQALIGAALALPVTSTVVLWALLGSTGHRFEWVFFPISRWVTFLVALGIAVVALLLLSFPLLAGAHAMSRGAIGLVEEKELAILDRVRASSDGGPLPKRRAVQVARP
jgi:hypothetical protein